MNSEPETRGINTLSEKSLHAALKAWYAQPGDRFEVEVDGSVIDIVRGDLLIEIQTRNFNALKSKLAKLVRNHPVRLIHPIPAQRWIVKLHPNAAHPSERRKSPASGRVEHIFRELIRIPHLIAHPNFSLEVLLVADEEVRVNDGTGSWRRKGWRIDDRRLLEVTASAIFTTPQDFARLLPDNLPGHFTVKDVAAAAALPVALTQKMVYCLRHMEVIQVVGKRGNALVYALTLD